MLAMPKLTALWFIVSFCKSLARLGKTVDMEFVACNLEGKLEVQVVGEQHTSRVILVHGANPAADILEEWDPIAAAIMQAGHSVYLPNFHSNARTRVGTLTNELFACIMNELKPVVLAGKSWGGGMVTKYMTRGGASTAITKLILAAPAGASPKDLALIKVPTLLLWAEDDKVVSFSKATELQKAHGGQNCQLISETVGGHRVLRQWGPRVAVFVGRVGSEL